MNIPVHWVLIQALQENIRVFTFIVRDFSSFTFTVRDLFFSNLHGPRFL